MHRTHRYSADGGERFIVLGSALSTASVVLVWTVAPPPAPTVNAQAVAAEASRDVLFVKLIVMLAPALSVAPALTYQSEAVAPACAPAWPFVNSAAFVQLFPASSTTPETAPSSPSVVWLLSTATHSTPMRPASSWAAVASAIDDLFAVLSWTDPSEPTEPQAAQATGAGRPPARNPAVSTRSLARRVIGRAR